jgi:dynein heavy chain
VRHGLMIVGFPYASKTSCLKVLAGALTQMNSEGVGNEMKTHISQLNPKSILIG